MAITVELINTGSELMLGRVLNTHQQWLCAELANIGLLVSRQVAVPDNGPAIQAAVRESLHRADLIITTGGLGPTSDDITRDLIAELLGVSLHEDPEVLAHIEKYFAQRNRSIPANSARQAQVPAGATVLQNAHGTAPGLVMECGQRKQLLVMLPGPPRELRPMFREQVVPILRERFGASAYVCRTFHTAGLGEVFVEERVARPLEELLQQGVELGYCARVGEVDVRLAASGADAESLVTAAEKIIREHLNEFIFGIDEATLESVVVGELIRRKETLAVAESCTGGLIAHRVTNVPGASGPFLAGLVTYSNEAKQRLLGVRAETLVQHGAVSEQTAREMAEGARITIGTDYAIAVTGIAGPSGGSPEKPVGTVYVALATPKKTIVEKRFNPYDRETFKFATSQQALDLLRRNLVQS